MIKLKNSRRSRVFLNQIIHDCVFFERPQNLLCRSTHFCTNTDLDLGLFLSKNLEVKFSRVIIRYKDTH